MQRVPITRDGYEVLQKELTRLKSVERPQTLIDLAEARAHGDLSENAEYDAAKEKHAFIEGRINELSHKLATADIIDPGTLNKDKVVFGCQVLLENIDTGEEVTYRLVGQEEANIDQGLISVASPLGRAMLGKVPGDAITLQAPGGKRSYELVEIL